MDNKPYIFDSLVLLYLFFLNHNVAIYTEIEHKKHSEELKFLSNGHNTSISCLYEFMLYNAVF